MNAIKKYKKHITIILTSLILLSATHVYAAVALDSDIISLIQQGISSLETFFSSKTEQQIEDLSTEKQAEIDSYIHTQTQEFIDEITNYQQEEYNRTQTDIDQYVEDLKSSLNEEINTEKQKVKEKIKSKAEEKANKEKKEIKDQFNESIESTITEFQMMN